MTEAQARRLGRLLASAREHRGLSLRALSAQTDIPPPWLIRVEQGAFTSPAPERLARLAEVLGIDPVRIDRASHDHLANSLPSVSTYFRSKAKASPEEIAEIEAAIQVIREKHDTSTKGGNTNDTNKHGQGRR